MSVRVERFTYDESISCMFVVATMFWGVVAMLVGLFVALELANPWFNLGTPWLSFGRLRPLHTNAAIFGWGIGSFFAAFYYMVQRLTRRPVWSPGLARSQLWWFNLTIVAAAVTLLLGYTTSKEYHELEWPVDIMVVVLWVVFSVNIIMTVVKRREEQMYVSLWFMLASLVGVAVLYLLNAAEVPVSLFKSYSAFAGTNDANVQWWFGHNAVAMVLTAPPLAEKTVGGDQKKNHQSLQNKVSQEISLLYVSWDVGSVVERFLRLKLASVAPRLSQNVVSQS